MRARISGRATRFFVVRHLVGQHSVGKPDRGATMVEYGIMVGLIAAVCLLVITTIGADVRDAFRWVEHRIP